MLFVIRSWQDGDIVVMNPNIPLDIFLPPEDFPDVELIIANDFAGLNTGFFMLKVNIHCKPSRPCELTASYVGVHLVNAFHGRHRLIQDIQG